MPRPCPLTNQQKVQNTYMPTSYYLLHISLSDISPEIWRTFVVPSSISLDRLHDVIQIVMGWNDCHLHEFIISNKRYTENPEHNDHSIESMLHTLGELLTRPGRSITYLYDFGDGWNHMITLVDNDHPVDIKQPHLFCIDGERACPPEDVGGVRGYEEFCNAINNKTHRKHADYIEWLATPSCHPKVFDTEKFNKDLVNLDLSKYQRWSRDRHCRWDLQNKLL